jgi:hypothetical protein
MAGSDSKSPHRAAIISKLTCGLQNVAERAVHDDFYYFLNAPVDYDGLCPLQFKHISSRPSSPGLLSRLPLEIQHEVLLILDLAALASLRLVNYYFKSTIDSFPPYARTQQHASILYRLLRDTKTISYHTLSTIYRALTSAACSVCGDFGPYLFVLTFHRCCANCLERNPAFRFLQEVGDCYKFFGVSQDEAMKLPSIAMGASPHCSNAFGHGFSCRCRGWERRQRPINARYFLVSQVHKMGLSIHGTQEALEKYTMAVYAKSVNRWNNTPQGRAAEHLINPLYLRIPSLRPLYDKNREERFFLNPLDGLSNHGAIRLPVLKLLGNEVETGLWCIGCQNIYERWLEEEEERQAEQNVNFVGSWEELKPLEMRAHRAWSKEGFLAHFEECEDAKKLWEA